MWGVIEGPLYPPAPTENYTEVRVQEQGQTDFTITPSPIRPQFSRLYVNGQKLKYDLDYTLNTLGALKYNSRDYPLKPTHKIELYHY